MRSPRSTASRALREPQPAGRDPWAALAWRLHRGRLIAALAAVLLVLWVALLLYDLL